MERPATCSITCHHGLAGAPGVAAEAPELTLGPPQPRVDYDAYVRSLQSADVRRRLKELCAIEQGRPDSLSHGVP